MPVPLHENPGSIVNVFTSYVPGYRLIDGEDLLIQAHLLFSTKNGLIGGAAQPDATPANSYINEFAAGISAVLPPGIPGRRVMVLNQTGSAMQIYGLGYNPLTGLPDTVAPSDSDAQGVLVVQAIAEACEYLCFAPGMWKQYTGLAGTGGGGGGIGEAPINTTTYGRLAAAWTPVVPIAGNATLPMTGPLILNVVDIANQNSAVNIDYVQNMVIDGGTY